MAPIKSTWAWRQTRFEKSGANGAKNRIIMVGRVRTSITSFWQIAVTSVPYYIAVEITHRFSPFKWTYESHPLAT